MNFCWHVCSKSPFDSYAGPTSCFVSELIHGLPLMWVHPPALRGRWVSNNFPGYYFWIILPAKYIPNIVSLYVKLSGWSTKALFFFCFACYRRPPLHGLRCGFEPWKRHPLEKLWPGVVSNHALCRRSVDWIQCAFEHFVDMLSSHWWCAMCCGHWHCTLQMCNCLCAKKMIHRAMCRVQSSVRKRHPLESTLEQCSNRALTTQGLKDWRTYRASL